MRYEKYLITEASFDPNKMKKTLQKIEKMDNGQERDNAIIKAMEDLYVLKRTLKKAIKKMSSKEKKEFDNSFEYAINAIPALADNLGNAKSVMKLYQDWIDVVNNIMKSR